MPDSESDHVIVVGLGRSEEAGQEILAAAIRV